MGREEQAKELKIRSESVVASSTIFRIEFFMGIAFTISRNLNSYAIGGILGWVMASLLTFYLLDLPGFVISSTEEGGEDINEEIPL